MAGFRPIRHLVGGAGGSFKTRRFEKTAASEVFPGDPLVLNATGLVSVMNPVSASSTPAQRACVGIAARIVADAEGKPKTFDTSGKSVFSPGGDADWIDVYVDPLIVYEATYHASAGQAEIGSLVSTSASTTAKTSATGQSGFVVQTGVTAAVTASTFRIIDISPRSLDQGNDKGSSAGLIEVIINNHAFGPGIGI